MRLSLRKQKRSGELRVTGNFMMSLNLSNSKDATDTLDRNIILSLSLFLIMPMIDTETNRSVLKGVLKLGTGMSENGASMLVAIAVIAIVVLNTVAFASSFGARMNTTFTPQVQLKLLPSGMTLGFAPEYLRRELVAVTVSKIKTKIAFSDVEVVHIVATTKTDDIMTMYYFSYAQIQGHKLDEALSVFTKDYSTDTQEAA